jgi:hypothetical protein
MLTPSANSMINKYGFSQYLGDLLTSIFYPMHCTTTTTTTTTATTMTMTTTTNMTTVTATAVNGDNNGGNSDGRGHRQQSTKIGSEDTVAVATTMETAAAGTATTAAGAPTTAPFIGADGIAFATTWEGCGCWL